METKIETGKKIADGLLKCTEGIRLVVTTLTEFKKDAEKEINEKLSVPGLAEEQQQQLRKDLIELQKMDIDKMNAGLLNMDRAFAQLKNALQMAFKLK